MKPLGIKSYGHIPHLQGSRMTPTDKHIHQGQQDIVTKKTRDGKDLIIVQEKLDGSNVAVAKIDGKLIPLSRSGYTAISSPYQQHHMFADFVESKFKRFENLLQDGERVCGEWMVQAHGTKYRLPHEPFVVFDIMRGHERVTYHELLLRVLPLGFVVPKLIHIGQPLKLKKAIEGIKESGHGALEAVEGVVYRCEREGKVDFLCKWVRPDKVDGKYLDGDPIYNFWSDWNG